MADYIVCMSHRARDYALHFIADKQSYHLAFSEHDIDHKGIYQVSSAEALAECLAIKGVRKLAAKRIPSLRKCWGSL